MSKTGQNRRFDGFLPFRLMEIERKWPAKEFLLVGCYLGIPPMVKIAWRLYHGCVAWVINGGLGCGYGLGGNGLF